MSTTFNLWADDARKLIRNRPGLAQEIVRQLAVTGGTSFGLTSRQRELLMFIRSHIGEHGIAPSYDEMMAAIGLASKSGVHRLVKALEERGYISRLPDRARAITLRAVA